MVIKVRNPTRAIQAATLIDPTLASPWQADCSARSYKTLRVTPAMEAGLATHVWGIDEIVGLLEVAEREPAA
jgi:hypothetical protein